jgi:hypothetical protein
VRRGGLRQLVEVAAVVGAPKGALLAVGGGLWGRAGLVVLLDGGGRDGDVVDGDLVGLALRELGVAAVPHDVPGHGRRGVARPGSAVLELPVEVAVVGGRDQVSKDDHRPGAGSRRPSRGPRPCLRCRKTLSAWLGAIAVPSDAIRDPSAL